MSSEAAWEVVQQFHNCHPGVASIQLWVHLWMVSGGISENDPRFDLLNQHDWDAIIDFCGDQEMKKHLETLRLMYS